MLRRGEISSETLVGIILVIAGAILIGFLYFAFFQNSGESRELCHLSVITRATAPTAAQSAIPLNCVADKVCFTTKSGKDNCYQFAGEEENKRAVKLPKDEEEAKQLILEESAKAMYDCWRMTGEGRLDLFGKAFQTYRSIETRCIVCSRLALAEDVKEKFPNIEKNLDLNEYLRNNTVPTSEFTYLQVFTGSSGVNTYVSVDERESENIEQQIKNSTYIEYNEEENEIKLSGEDVLNPIVRKDSDEMAFIFAQRKTPKGFGGGFVTGARDSTIVIVGVAVTASRIPIVGKFVTKSLLSWPGALISLVTISGTGLYAGINSRSQQTASVAFCGNFSSSLGGEDKNKNREGCSVVRAVPYKPEYVNALCQHIEGEL